MDKLILITILTFVSSLSMQAQTLSDEEAIYKRLKGENIDGKYTWRPTDEELKELAKKLILERRSEITEKGIQSLSFILTGDEYDDQNDSFFLNTLIDIIDVQTLIKDCAFVGRHFKKSLYSNESIEKLSSLANPEEILKWQSWVPYYLSFLEIDSIDLTIIFIKENIDAVNHLHFALYNEPFRFDTIDLNVCLARLGKLNDTLVISQLEEKLHLTSKKDYRSYIEHLTQIRSQYAFQKIGNVMLSDLEEIKSDKERKTIKQMALAAFLVYVENFPDRSTKIQETIYIWGFVEFSSIQGKDYSTDKYMEMAKNWYIKNKGNLILDSDKY